MLKSVAKDLQTVEERLRAKATDLCGSGFVPGYLVGVYHAGEQVVVAAGVANLNTGAPMTEDTGYLIGSITKPITATLLMQCVERGQIDLEERVTTYLPEFQLSAPAKTVEIRVKNLVNHTSGIDGDFFWPDQVTGRDALKYYVEEARRMSTLFDPGKYVSYCTSGVVILGRVLEAVTGKTYHELLENEIFGPIGMTDSCDSAEQAILRRTAIGHFFNREKGQLRPTDMFKLPDSMAAGGSTPICTIGDLLAFARTHLAGGVAPTGARVLSTEMANRMRTPTTPDMGTPTMPPIGLGWPIFQFGKATVLAHSGASPGGVAQLMIVPEHDLAFASFGNGPASGKLDDELTQWLLREYLGIEVPDVFPTRSVPDLRKYEGIYRADMMRVEVKAVDGQLEERVTYEPINEHQASLFSRFTGGAFPYPPYRLDPVREGVFVMAGTPAQLLNGIARVRMAVSFHGEQNGRPVYRNFGGSMTRRAEG